MIDINKYVCDNIVSERSFLSMKKKLFILIAFTFIFTGGCGNKEVEVKLTKDNFEDYFIIEGQISDFEVDEDVVFSKEYKGKANLAVNVRLKKEVRCENVKIEGTVITSDGIWFREDSVNFGGGAVVFRISIDIEGKGSNTVPIETEWKHLRPHTPSVEEIDFSHIEGSIFE